MNINKNKIKNILNINFLFIALLLGIDKEELKFIYFFVFNS